MEGVETEKFKEEEGSAEGVRIRRASIEKKVEENKKIKKKREAKEEKKKKDSFEAIDAT